MSSLKLEHGKRYVTRDGRVVGPLRTTAMRNSPYAGTHPFMDGYMTWKTNGEFSAEGVKTDLDLVSLAPGEITEVDPDEPLMNTTAPMEQVVGPLESFDRQIQTITQRRGDVYGHPADDFKTASDLMKHFDDIEPEELRHALRMICVKLARLSHSPTHLDSYVDIAGYARTAVMVIDKLKMPTK